MANRHDRPGALAGGQVLRAALAERVVAGRALRRRATAEDGVGHARALLDRSGLRRSLFYLGEHVDAPALVENAANQLAVAEALGRAGLDVHVSVDPTQVGRGLDPGLARRHVFALAGAVARSSNNRPGVHCAMLDMEDRSVTDATIALHDEVVAAGLPVALTLQAYLRRTEADLQAQIRRGAKVRLVKGAFAAGRDAAFTRRRDIKAISRRLVDLMLSRGGRDAGFYPIVATHDERLHAHAVERVEANGWRRGEYEFEMLLGVRGDVARDRARHGHRVCLYVPFGRDWWPHPIRRVGESPRNAWLLARSVVGAA